MKLNITDLNVIINTLNGSLQIDDRGHFMFYYTPEYRKDLSIKIQEFLNSVSVNVETEENIGN